MIINNFYLILYGILICRDYTNYNDNDDYDTSSTKHIHTQTVSKDDIFLSHCMCHQTICAKLIMYTVRGVVCVDHMNNSVVRSSYMSESTS